VTVVSQDIENELGPCGDVRRVGSPSGMGECWRVERGGEVVACKVITAEADRFEREVEAMARLKSPRVVRIRGRGKMAIAATGQECLYLLSDFIEGGDARQNVQAGLPTDDELRAFLSGVLEGLVALHGAGVIHRDIKPENIVLRAGNWSDPVVIDLGLARLPDLVSVTQYPWVGGTWPYMAPEQLSGQRATERSDMWSVAVVAYEMGMGRHPFRSENERTPPQDWESRLQRGFPQTDRLAGLDSWLSINGAYQGYRRHGASRALQHLNEVWK
jgi:serine/threonine protein kinase